jgi:L-proline amide hydrolase
MTGVVSTDRRAGVPVATGTVAFRDHRTWYQLSGTPGAGRPVLVVLHGGPGSTHDYLARLAELTASGTPVLLYDQLGNGGSTHLPDRGADFWTVRLFQDELDNLLRTLGFESDYVLLGHSWGGMLGAVHGAARPAGLRGLIVSNSPASYPLWLAEVDRLRRELPEDVQAVLARHEAAGTERSQEYFEAARVFYDRHICRVLPWPGAFTASFMEISNDPTVYYTMNGPAEFRVTGSLRDWSVLEYLPEIEVPTLVLSGRYDDAAPAAVRPFHELIPDARWEIFEESSHVPHLEEPERFDRVVLEFLTTLE